jgi:hypothetical protein
MVRELLGREEIHVEHAPSDSPAMSIGETIPKFLSASCRLLDLLNNTQDIPFLNGLILREIIYRILRGPEDAPAIDCNEIKVTEQRKLLRGLPPTILRLSAWKNSQSLRARECPRCIITSVCSLR